MKREYPEHPIIGVGGIVFHNDQVLLIQRGKEPGLGQWSIPGGAVNTGETLKEAVVREVFEETHLEVEAVMVAKVLERIFRDPGGRVAYHYVLVDFYCRFKKGLLVPDSDAQDARFVPLENLPSYQVATITLEVIHWVDQLRKNPALFDSLSHMANLYG
jgi:ADP-ribose pyrophosphatase YjhB (NUDIX family)